jgi:hypothetical protein
MTPEELDRARSDEAWRIWERQPDSLPETATIAARLAREGWMPPEPVDPDVAAVREVVAAEWEAVRDKASAAEIRDGRRDGSHLVRIALAAYKAGRNAEAERANVLVEPAEAIVNRAVKGTGPNGARWVHIVKAARRLEGGLTAYKAGKTAR